MTEAGALEAAFGQVSDALMAVARAVADAQRHALASLASSAPIPAAELAAPAVLPLDGCSLLDAKARYERQLVEQALARTAGNRAAAARLLRVNRTTLVEAMKRLGLANWKPGEAA